MRDAGTTTMIELACCWARLESGGLRMAVKQDYRFAVLKYMYDSPFGENVQPSLIWPPDMIRDVFMGNTGYSVRDFWIRATLGMLRPSFEFPNRLWLPLHRSHAELRNDRGAIIAAARSKAQEDGFDLTGFDGIIAFMNPAGMNAGAKGGDAVLDQAASLPMYLHEVGHMMGLQHAFGVAVPIGDEDGPVYNDTWDIMGNQWRKAFPVEPFAGWEDVNTIHTGFWRSTVGPCAANLWRRFWGTRVFDDGARVAYIRRGERRWIRAWTTAHGSALDDPLLLVAQDGDGGPTVTVELRLPYWADATGWTATTVKGVLPVHSFRYRQLQPDQHEVYPAWEESSFEMAQGASFSTPGEGRWRITVVGIDHRAGNTRAEVLVE